MPVSVARRIKKSFEQYVKRVQSLGYNSLSFDDLAHLADMPFYPQKTHLLLQDYQELYTHLFSIAKQHNMRVFINTDYLFCNDEIRSYMQKNDHTAAHFFTEVLSKAFYDFPQIDGVILRIGENDGKDVTGTFLSQLELRTPKQANALLRHALPFFEAHGKLLVFRTWTVGVHKIGDLIWNKRTFDMVFRSIKSDALIISMKFGDTDFMRYLALNPLFFHSPHKKIIELQARREWEGMGMYLSFVGWDYGAYIRQLQDNSTLVGIHVWCQTGGWSQTAWTSVTYLEKSSFWNELNTEVTIALYKNKGNVQAALTAFCTSRNITHKKDFIRLLELSEIAIKKGLYIPELAEKQLYFRRTRLPTLLWLMWNKVLLEPPIIHALRLLVAHPEKAMKASVEALRAIDEMITIAAKLHLPSSAQDSLQFQKATFIIFSQLRHYIFGSLSPDEIARLNKAVAAYSLAFPQHYSIPQVQRIKRRRYIPRQSLSIPLRKTSAYRKRDKIALSTSAVQRLLVNYYLQKTRSQLENQSMGLGVLFK